MKYAIVEDGGKQYKAVEGGVIEVDYFIAEVGEGLDLNHVLLISDGEDISIGAPHVPGAVVKTTVLGQIKGDKVIIFRYSPKKRIRTKKGHRQKYTRLQVDSISVNGAE